MDTTGNMHNTTGDKHNTTGDKHNTTGDKHNTTEDKHNTTEDEHNTTVTSTDLTEDIHDINTSVNSTNDIDDALSLSSIETISTEHDDTSEFTFIDSEDIHDTRPVTSAVGQAKDIKWNKVDKMEFEKNKDLQELISSISMNHHIFLIMRNRNNVISKPASQQTSALKSVFNPKSQLSETNEDVAKSVLTRRKLVKRNNSNSMNKNESDKKSQDYQSTKNRICLPKVKMMFCFLLSLFLLSFLYYIYSFLHMVPLHNDHKNQNNIDFMTIAQKKIFDQIDTVQKLTEYLQKDTPLLKITALIGNTNVDKSYMINVIRKMLCKRSSKGSLHVSKLYYHGKFGSRARFHIR